MDVQRTYMALNDNMTWKYHTSQTGNTEVALPTDAKEYYILAKVSPDGTTFTPDFPFVIPKALTDSQNDTPLFGGYYVSSSVFGWAAVTIGAGKAKLSGANKNGVAVTNTSAIDIYYR